MEQARHGTLEKRSRQGTWQRRVFRFDRGFLSYWQNVIDIDAGKEPDVAIDLYSEVAAIRDKGGRLFDIQFKDAKARPTMQLRAPNVAERQAWASMLREAHREAESQVRATGGLYSRVGARAYAANGDLEDGISLATNRFMAAHAMDESERALWVNEELDDLFADHNGGSCSHGSAYGGAAKATACVRACEGGAAALAEVQAVLDDYIAEMAALDCHGGSSGSSSSTAKLRAFCDAHMTLYARNATSRLLMELDPFLGTAAWAEAGVIDSSDIGGAWASLRSLMATRVRLDEVSGTVSARLRHGGRGSTVAVMSAVSAALVELRSSLVDAGALVASVVDIAGREVECRWLGVVRDVCSRPKFLDGSGGGIGGGGNDSGGGGELLRLLLEPVEEGLGVLDAEGDDHCVARETLASSGLLCLLSNLQQCRLEVGFGSGSGADGGGRDRAASAASMLPERVLEANLIRFAAACGAAADSTEALLQRPPWAGLSLSGGFLTGELRNGWLTCADTTVNAMACRFFDANPAVVALRGDLFSCPSWTNSTGVLAVAHALSEWASRAAPFLSQGVRERLAAATSQRCALWYLSAVVAAQAAKRAAPSQAGIHVAAECELLEETLAGLRCAGGGGSGRKGGFGAGVGPVAAAAAKSELALQWARWFLLLPGPLASAKTSPASAGRGIAAAFAAAGATLGPDAAARYRASRCLYDLARVCLKLRPEVGNSQRRLALALCAEVMAQQGVGDQESDPAKIAKGAQEVLRAVFPQAGTFHSTGKTWKREAMPNPQTDREIATAAVAAAARGIATAQVEEAASAAAATLAATNAGVGQCRASWSPRATAASIDEDSSTSPKITAVSGANSQTGTITGAAMLAAAVAGRRGSARGQAKHLPLKQSLSRCGSGSDGSLTGDTQAEDSIRVDGERVNDVPRKALLVPSSNAGAAPSGANGGSASACSNDAGIAAAQPPLTPTTAEVARARPQLPPRQAPTSGFGSQRERNMAAATTNGKTGEACGSPPESAGDGERPAAANGPQELPNSKSKRSFASGLWEAPAPAEASPAAASLPTRPAPARAAADAEERSALALAGRWAADVEDSSSAGGEAGPVSSARGNAAPVMAAAQMPAAAAATALAPPKLRFGTGLWASDEAAAPATISSEDLPPPAITAAGRATSVPAFQTTDSGAAVILPAATTASETAAGAAAPAQRVVRSASVAAPRQAATGQAVVTDNSTVAGVANGGKPRRRTFMGGAWSGIEPDKVTPARAEYGVVSSITAAGTAAIAAAAAGAQAPAGAGAAAPAPTAAPFAAPVDRRRMLWDDQPWAPQQRRPSGQGAAAAGSAAAAPSSARRPDARQMLWDASGGGSSSCSPPPPGSDARDRPPRRREGKRREAPTIF